MKATLWYVLTGTRGGANRVRLPRAMDERPRNANQFADNLDLDYKTVRHHLEVLADNGVVEDSGDVFAMAHYDTDRDETYTANGASLMNGVAIDVPAAGDMGDDGSSDGGADGMSEDGMNDSEGGSSGDADGSPGFGIAVALVELLGAALLAYRRD